MQTNEDIKRKQKEYRQKNKERIKAYKLKYRQEHKSEISLYRKQYREQNRERERQQEIRYRETHQEELKKQNKKRYWNHRQEQLAYRREWGKKNREKERIMKIKTGRKLRRQIRLKALDVLGGKCVRCGFSDERALQVDHINGNGIAHRKQFGNQTRFYKHIIEGTTEGLQLLCANCNAIKRVENKEYVNYEHTVQTAEGES